MYPFNVRVYGILINDQDQVLLSDEEEYGFRFSKFPGGGLEYGEGLIDALKREFVEEMNLKIEVEKHLYTTDFYQRSAFNAEHQIISIYYLVKPMGPILVPLRNRAFDFDAEQLKAYEKNGETETFRFVAWDEFSEDSVTLPIDKLVAQLIKNSL